MWEATVKHGDLITAYIKHINVFLNKELAQHVCDCVMINMLIYIHHKRMEYYQNDSEMLIYFWSRFLLV